MVNKTMKTLTIGNNIIYEIVDETARNNIATKQAVITGAATTITDNNLTVNRALISDSDGKVAVSAITSDELEYLAHNYAGSSSAGGSATSANKLNVNAGSDVHPVYFNNGVPVETAYTLNKSVPSNAVFTDTTYNAATTSIDGLMSASDKNKLDNIEIGATKNTIINYSVILSSTGWSNSAPYTQTVSVDGILETDAPIVDVDMSNVTTVDAGSALLEAWSYIGRILTSDNSIIVYCYEDVPEIDIPIQIQTTR